MFSWRGKGLWDGNNFFLLFFFLGGDPGLTIVSIFFFKAIVLHILKSEKKKKKQLVQTKSHLEGPKKKLKLTRGPTISRSTDTVVATNVGITNNYKGSRETTISQEGQYTQ